VRIAVTGAAGRLGSEIVRQLRGADLDRRDEISALDRDSFDLDDPAPGIEAIVAAPPDVVIHAAAWTDVDGCALDPDRAQRRNGEATAMLASACAGQGIGLMVISTNEVFDGERTDGRGYAPTDVPNPGNAYGRSKLAGEDAARSAYAGRESALGIVRTAWLFGAGAPDFPERIEAAARRAVDARVPLRLVRDEIGTPTFVPDLADAIIRLVRHGYGGTHHVVNRGSVSRAGWARRVLERIGLEVEFREVDLAEFDRPSRPPRWGVLAATPLPGGQLRDWQDALDERLRDRDGGHA